MNDINLSIDNKLEEIKKKIGIWKIKENLSKEEIIDLNEIFELHWRHINLLSKKLDRERQFKKERDDIIDKYWKLTNDREEKIKSENKLIDKKWELNINEKNKKIKRIVLLISEDLREKIDSYMKENFFNMSLFFSESLKAYKNGMNLNFELEISENKKQFSPSVSFETLEIYQTIPKKNRKKQAEIILGSYLEKELMNDRKFNF